MIKRSDLKYILFAVALMVSQYLIFSPRKENDILKEHLIKDNKRLQVISDSAEARAEKSEKLRIEDQKKYKNQLNKFYDEYIPEIRQAVSNNNISKLDSIANRLKSAGLPRQRTIIDY